MKYVVLIITALLVGCTPIKTSKIIMPNEIMRKDISNIIYNNTFELICEEDKPCVIRHKGGMQWGE